MTKREEVVKEIQKVPDTLLDEIFDFISFLKAKVAMKKSGDALLSESSLRKDWLRPEEDEAWKNL